MSKIVNMNKYKRIKSIQNKDGSYMFKVYAIDVSDKELEMLTFYTCNNIIEAPIKFSTWLKQNYLNLSERYNELPNFEIRSSKTSEETFFINFSIEVEKLTDRVLLIPIIKKSGWK